MSNITLLTGDCTKLLSGVPTASVDSIVTDPPYPCIQRPYGYWTEAEWFALMDVVVPECRRSLKPTGSAVFILQPNSERIGRMRTWLWDFLSKWGREWGIVQDVYWWNHTAMPEAHSIQGRLTRPSLKYCVWLGRSDCFRNQEAVLKDAAEQRLQSRKPGRETQPSGHGVDRRRMNAANTTGKSRPFNVLPFPNGSYQRQGSGRGHPACTPLDLCEWWVRYITPPGGTVLDPFSGAATVGVAAKRYGFAFIGIEQRPEYQTTSAQRLGVEIPTPDAAPDKVA